MNIIRYPEKSEWQKIVERPHLDVSQLNETVASVLADVKQRGDEAVKGYELKFDHVDLPSLEVTKDEIAEAEKLVTKELREAIQLAHANIKTFHESQRFRSKKVETLPGVTCWQKSVPIEKVGLYIPGGTAPLFSTVLMLATPAKIAGCKEIVLCTRGQGKSRHPSGSADSRCEQDLQGWWCSGHWCNGLRHRDRSQGL